MMLRPARIPPTCFTCDIVFKTWKDLENHNTVLHDRYESTDKQRKSWDQHKGFLPQIKDDYMICADHLKKLTADGKCPVVSCNNGNFIKKSYYLELKRQGKI
jgi:hypothetical protein